MLKKTLPVMLTVILAASGFVSAQTVSTWTTRGDRSALLKAGPGLVMEPVSADTGKPGITVDPEKTFQKMDGFGFALTGGSAQHLMRMQASARHRLLESLFAPDPQGLGISYLRVSIGSSDLNDHTFSYDDLPEGETDTALKAFNLAEDTADVVPVLKEILAISPSIQILASPWSAPVWMKTNHAIQGGHLQTRYYPVYARYFVRYLRAMQHQGIHINAVTVQNEPFNDGNTPSMQFFAKEELAFVKNDLGPAFYHEGIQTKILIYDHNCDAPEYPISILTDPGARKYIDGSAFHLYAGDVSAMTEVHDAFPKKHLYFTEYMIVNFTDSFAGIAAKVSRILIGATRNWSRNVILWNLAADAHFEPHTSHGGCTMCQGAVTVEGDSIVRNEALYAMAHFSRFVPSGSVRIASTETSSLHDVAFRTPTGKTVLIVANPGKTAIAFRVRMKEKSFPATLAPDAVATYRW